MRNPERIDVIIGKVQNIWKKNPDLRFGQLILMLYLVYDQKSGHAALNTQYLVEDDQFLRWLETFDGFDR